MQPTWNQQTKFPCTSTPKSFISNIAPSFIYPTVVTKKFKKPHSYITTLETVVLIQVSALIYNI